MKRFIVCILTLGLLFTLSGCQKESKAEKIVKEMTLEQKAAQMVQPSVVEVSVNKMQENCYGSILSKNKSVFYTEWRSIVNKYQKAAMESEAKIPYLYGQDDVHGVNYATNTVIFPHNIGLGAANNPELMYEIGKITADEAKLCYMLWNFAPCVAQSTDPRWGRTYESYGSNLELISSLSTQYTKGLIDGGVVACAKHFFADGNVLYGTGENSDEKRLIDRGNAELNDEEIAELLKVYQALIDEGVQTIMVSHSSLNGVKMHENARYLQYLKNEMGFKGFVVSDWDSVQNTSASTYKEQVVNAVNAGIDMLMETKTYESARWAIINAAKSGEISEDRINDAVTRIIQVKLDVGIFDDPFNENLKTEKYATGSHDYRMVAEQAVEESLVLVKNENSLLPLKEGMTVLMVGPAMDNAQVQCGGWTLDWNNSPTEDIPGVTTIYDGFMEVGRKCGINFIKDRSKVDEADVILLVVGEQSYAEWMGDSPDMALCGEKGLKGNTEAIEFVKETNKPTVTCIVAGRQVIIDEYKDNWDSIVMCYLPGSEGRGVANVLCGLKEFKGKLPSPWYSSVTEIGTEKCWLAMGYGLEY